MIPNHPGVDAHRIRLTACQLLFCGNVVPSNIKPFECGVRNGLANCIELWTGQRRRIKGIYRIESNGVSRMSSLPRRDQESPT